MATQQSLDHQSIGTPTTRRTRLLGAALSLATLVACGDPSSVLAPHITPTTPHSGTRTLLFCSATKHEVGTGAPSVTCTPTNPQSASRMMGSAARGPNADIIKGRQNIDVYLGVTGFAFNAATNVFSFTATVQNLMVQPIGTTNGTTATTNGVDVFFVAGPSTTSGTGTVTALGTLTGTFTASNQPYYKYAQLIKPDSTSPGVLWQFQLGTNVTSFNFSVEVDAATPADQSVLHWNPIRPTGVNSNQLFGVWQDATTDVYAVGVLSTVLHYDGTTWTSVATGLHPFTFRAISGKSSNDVWVVGDGGVTVHSNGSAWSQVTSGSTANLRGVWERAAGDVYAVGGAGVALHYNGSAWSVQTTGVTDSLRAVWGADSTHVFAVGDNGRILLGNGAHFTALTSNTTQALRGVWGTSATDVYAVGNNGTVMHYNGTTWSAMTSGVTAELDGVGGSATGDIWAVGASGTTIHYNGTAWSTSAPVIGLSLHAVTSGSSAPVWAVGDAGALISFSGSAWSLSTQSGIPIKSIWASSAHDVWATSLGTVLHYNGTAWSTSYVSPSDTMFALWGFDSADVHLVGANGNVAIWNGSTWTFSTVQNALGQTMTGLDAEWGGAANALCAVGTAGEYVCNRTTGGDVTGTVTGANTLLTSIWGSMQDTLFVAGANGAIYTTRNHGNSWSTMTTPTPAESLFAVYGTGPTAMWAAGKGGTIYTSTGTNTWTAQTSNTTNTLRHLWAGTPPSGYTADVYAVGDNGTVQHYNGTIWTSMATNLTSTLRAVYGTSSTNVYIGGDNGVVLVGTQ